MDEVFSSSATVFGGASSINTARLVNGVRVSETYKTRTGVTKKRVLSTDLTCNPWHFCYMFRRYYRVNRETCWTMKAIQQYHTKEVQLSGFIYGPNVQLLLEESKEKSLYNILHGESIDPDILLQKPMLCISTNAKLLNYMRPKPINICLMCNELLNSQKNIFRQKIIEGIKKREKIPKSQIPIYALKYHYIYSAFKIEYPFPSVVFFHLFRLGIEIYRLFDYDPKVLHRNLHYLIFKNSFPNSQETSIEKTLFLKFYDTSLFFEEPTLEESDENRQLVEAVFFPQQSKSTVSIMSTPTGQFLQTISLQRSNNEQKMKDCLGIIKKNFEKLEYKEILLSIIVEQSANEHLIKSILKKSVRKLTLKTALEILNIDPTHPTALQCIKQFFSKAADFDVQLQCLEALWKAIECEFQMEENAKFLLEQFWLLDEKLQKKFSRIVKASPLYIMYDIQEVYIGPHLYKFLTLVHNYKSHQKQ